jgi:hypothetical protein
MGVGGQEAVVPAVVPVDEFDMAMGDPLNPTYTGGDVERT